MVQPSITTVEHLEDLLSEPTEGVVETLSKLEGDLLILGAGGKMGPSLARMARRASEQAGNRRRILAVSRFSTGNQETYLRAQRIETIRCDLLDPGQLERLPDAANVIVMVGMKFGSTGQEALTWAMNCYLPGLICQKFRHSRIVVFSTGNVYGLTPVSLGGSLEGDPFHPEGDYALSCVGRERIYEHFSQTLHIPLALLRLNYAVEMRYGVLVDVARKVYEGQPVNLTMGNFNAIWQADANAMALGAFAYVATPPFVINLAGPEILSVRRVAEKFGRLFGKPVILEGNEANNALLSNGQMGHRLFGYPRVGTQQMIHWIADWVKRGGHHLGKPTHFEVRDGKF
jgi:nucleoside-diphosphate-sugar epimerase